MNARTLFGAVCLSALVAAGNPTDGRALAQTPVPRATLTAHAGAITGIVTDGNDAPIPGARLRLRDVSVGRIVMTTRGDQNGQFRFAGVPAGSYLVELVDEAGIVRAVGHTFRMPPGGTITTFIRFGAQARWYTGFFANAAMAAVSSAAGLGVTAVGNGFQPASGRF